ncbi:LysE family translocator [Pseudomonas capeferrum]|uniref:LysE family translocator n=1 Tax=Pseudomonas capeferrum TaxID=1495066 RepID=UPI0015E3B1A4|nr:LysE family translocator [Pseudomonas capeferrum]MBA1202567.1 LysE family translocator [Pseudomonas capeferrum]
MDLDVLAAFWAVSFLFVITPGADWAYAISAGLQGRFVVPAVAGLLCGHLVATLTVAAGVGGLIMKLPYALTMLTICGAGYLFCLGLKLLRNPPLPSRGEGAQVGTWSSWALKGLCVSGMNPKVFLLFLALLPPFTDPLRAWSLPFQILTLGMIHAISCGVVYLVVGFSAKAALGTRPGAAILVSRISGTAMIIIALVLAVERLLSL